MSDEEQRIAKEQDVLARRDQCREAQHQREQEELERKEREVWIKASSTEMNRRRSMMRRNGSRLSAPIYQCESAVH